MTINRYIIAAGVALIAAAPAAFACATCFGEPNTPQTNGLNAAILTLLGFTGVALAGVTTFAATIVYRIRRAEQDEATEFASTQEILS